jgi:general stress protein CsbA
MPVGSRFELPFERYSKESLLTFSVLTVTHFIFLTIAVVVINELFFDIDLLHPKLRMDASWYWKISQEGYSYTPGKQSSVAFYPLFPLLWKWTGLGYLGIVLVNMGLLLSSLYLLATEYRIRGFHLLILLAVPSLVFSFVPYSESTFFLGATLLLLGFKKDSILLIIIGAAISCSARSASVILILCFIFTYLICENQTMQWKRVRLYLVAILTAIIASMAVRWFQVYQAGAEFSLFEVQTHWNRQLRFPTFPLTTLSQKSLVWNDFLALFTAMICGSLIIRTFLRRIEKRDIVLEPELILACLYIAGIASVTLLFSGTLGDRGTSIHSLNRFIFSTPFFTIFLIYIFNQAVINRRVLYPLGLLFFCLYLSFIIGSTGKYATLPFQIQVLGYFSLMFCLVLLYLASAMKRYTQIFWPVLYSVCLLLQAYLYCAHLAGLRVG